MVKDNKVLITGMNIISSLGLSAAEKVYLSIEDMDIDDFIETENDSKPNILAKLILGLIFLNGDQVEIDYVKAMKLWGDKASDSDFKRWATFAAIVLVLPDPAQAIILKFLFDNSIALSWFALYSMTSVFFAWLLHTLNS